MTELTDLARRYGVITEPLELPKILQGYKSGYTPTKAWAENLPLPSPSEFLLRMHIETYQRNIATGYTMGELEALDAHGVFKPALTANLSNEIHPLLKLERWETTQTAPLHIPPYPLPDGLDGYFEARNPAVWSALEPSLRLASQLLTHTHCSLWFDALLLGEYKNLRTGPEANGKHLKSFWHREAYDIAQSHASWNQKIRAVEAEFRFAIRDGHTNALTGLPDDESWAASTDFTPLYPPPGCIIFLDLNTISPLLTGGMTSGEIGVQHCNIAITILHEFCHAIWSMMDQSREVSGEAYFEDEPVGELGFSMENHYFGGTCQPIVESHTVGEPRPFMGLWRHSWPNKDEGYGQPILGCTPEMEWEYSFPVPVSWAADLMQEDFWRHYFQSFGMPALRPAPLVSGRRFNKELGYQRIPNSKLKAEVVLSQLGGRTTDTARSEGQEFINNRTMVDKQISTAYKSRKAADMLLFKTMKDADLILDEPDGENSSSDGDTEQLEDFQRPIRYDFILGILVTYYKILALESMKFGKFPEHTLLSYINRLKDMPDIAADKREDLPITSKEFREFLQHCQSRGCLFYWNEQEGCGYLWRVDHGWPKTPPDEAVTAHSLPPEGDGREQLQGFNRKMKSYAEQYLESDEAMQFPDIDIELLRLTYNRKCKTNIEKPLWELLWRNPESPFTPGPPGIMRIRMY